MTTSPETKLPLLQRILAWLFPVSAATHAELARKTDDIKRLKADVEELRVIIKRHEDSKERERIDGEMRKKVQQLLAAAQAETWRRPADKLEAEDLQAAFDIAADNSLWQAVHQLLDDAIQDAVEDSSQAPAGGKFTDADRSFASGGVDYLREFQKELIAQRAKSRVKAAATATQEKE